jgi:hypothetical protein
MDDDEHQSGDEVMTGEFTLRYRGPSCAGALPTRYERFGPARSAAEAAAVDNPGYVFYVEQFGRHVFATDGSVSRKPEVF